MRKAEKQRQQFLAKIIELLQSVGAVETDSTYRFSLETKAGRLTLHPDPNDTMGIGNVFTRFDDPPRAVAILGQAVNQHSGKWNHHYFDGWSVEAALADFEIQIRTVL
jgi:hypothetical protein